MLNPRNRYAEAAIRIRRATLAGEVHALTKQIAQKRVQIAHLDATLRIFDPNYRKGPSSVKQYKRTPLFAHGELGRAILDVLREADGEPLAAHVIADRVRAKLGMPDITKMAITSRVRGNLTYLKGQKGFVTKSGQGKNARWALA